MFLDGRAVSTIMEVKRQQSSLKSIKSDLERLYKVKQAKPEIRCFLLLVSQKKRPKHFVTTNGLAKRGFLSDMGIPCKVIRVCKAAASFRKEKSAHYVCLVEVQ